jgi:hypothetical protein
MLSPPSSPINSKKTSLIRYKTHEQEIKLSYETEENETVEMPEEIQVTLTESIQGTEFCPPTTTGPVSTRNRSIEKINRVEKSKIHHQMKKGWECEYYIQQMKSIRMRRQELKSVIDAHKISLNRESR